MNRCVLDASIAAKWYLPNDAEPLAREALALLLSYTTGQTEVLVPDLFYAEVGNILWKAERQGRCSPDVGDAAVTGLVQAGFRNFASPPLLSSALRLARAHGRTVYDSLYLVLAVQESATMITADEKLANAVAAYLPVKWLGAL